MIIDESNLYATQQNTQLCLTTEELDAFLGILIVMGFHSLPTMRSYWSTNENFHVERVSKVFSLKRFLKITRYLHINNNEKMPQPGTPSFDKLYKLRPLIDHLTSVFQTAFTPYRHLSVDESMCAFKGRTTLKQYMPMKPIKRGFKDYKSTTHVLRTNKVGQRESVPCPEAISDYNRYMGGVDRFDQYHANYSISWKSRRWWMKIFYYLVDASIVNSYVLYRETLKKKNPSAKPLSALQFRSQLADDLIGSFCQRQKPGPPSKKKSQGSSHLPVKGTYRRCVLCSSSKKKQTRSNIICELCNVALCKDCFAPYHSN
nr:unnamed protein product [Callosobruchus chinensis]